MQTMFMHTKRMDTQIHKAITRPECFIICVLFVAFILSIVEKTLDPWCCGEDEPPKNIYQERNFWAEPNTSIGTATIPSPSPSPEIPDFNG